MASLKQRIYVSINSFNQYTSNVNTHSKTTLKKFHNKISCFSVSFTRALAHTTMYTA